MRNIPKEQRQRLRDCGNTDAEIDEWGPCADCDEGLASSPDGRCRDCDIAYCSWRGACRECDRTIWREEIGGERFGGPKHEQHADGCSLAHSDDYVNSPDSWATSPDRQGPWRSEEPSCE